MILINNALSLLSLFVVAFSGTEAFAPSLNNARTFTTSISLNLFGKMFEEEGPLGKGITVGKFQLGLSCNDRTLIELLEKESDKYDSDEPEELSKLCNSVCLTLLRRQDDWISACSESEWFGQNDAGKAERIFNDWSNQEASKFEKGINILLCMYP